MSKVFALAAKAGFYRYIDTDVESSPGCLKSCKAAIQQFKQLQDAIPETLHQSLLDLDVLYSDRESCLMQDSYYQGFADGIKFLIQAFGYEGRMP